MSRRDPDHEFVIMRRGLAMLADLTPAGRARVLAYWCARSEALPPPAADAGPQQLDIEDEPVLPLRGAAP